jgi:hypothetical protein
MSKRRDDAGDEYRDGGDRRIDVADDGARDPATSQGQHPGCRQD